jgi:hypothetical protein
MFEAILLELPQDTTLAPDLLRSLYLQVMDERLCTMIMPLITPETTWEQVADLAINMDTVLHADPALARRHLNPEKTTSFATTTHGSSFLHS